MGNYAHIAQNKLDSFSEYVTNKCEPVQFIAKFKSIALKKISDSSENPDREKTIKQHPDHPRQCDDEVLLLLVAILT